MLATPESRRTFEIVREINVMLATRNRLVKASSISILVMQLVFSPLGALAATTPTVGTPVESTAPVNQSSDQSLVPSSNFGDDFGSAIDSSAKSNPSNSSVSSPELNAVPAVETAAVDPSDSGQSDQSKQSLLQGETPILDSVVNGDLLAQGDSTKDMPILREGISMSADELESKIDDLTRQILLKEIELERFGIHYNQEVAKQGRWKGWRYGLLQEVNSGLGLAGGIISVYNRGKHLNTPQNVKRQLQESANYIPMIGTIIGASAAGLEFGINEYHMFQAGRKGFSAKKSRVRVQALRNEIDSMLEARAKLLATESTMPAPVELNLTERKNKFSETCGIKTYSSLRDSIFRRGDCSLSNKCNLVLMYSKTSPMHWATNLLSYRSAVVSGFITVMLASYSRYRVV